MEILTLITNSSQGISPDSDAYSLVLPDQPTIKVDPITITRLVELGNNRLLETIDDYAYDTGR